MNQDANFMLEALKQARQAQAKGESYIGADASGRNRRSRHYGGHR